MPKARSTKPRDFLPRWSVYQIRKKADLIGTFHAKTEAAALARAIEEYRITDPERRKRLFARMEPQR